MRTFIITAIHSIIIITFVGCTDVKRSSKVDFGLLKQELHEGDLLFRRGIGVLGRAVVATDDEGRFSHVGIAVKIDNQWKVVHAVPDEPDFEGDFDRVKCEPIESFYSEFRAGNGAVYRLDAPADKIEIAVANAIRISNEKRPFDHDYNLGDTTAMYCTELVEYVFGLSGVPMSEGRQTHVNFPSMTGDYIMPSDLTKNNKLNPIYSF